MVPRCLQALLDNVSLLGSAVGQPASQREDGHLQSGRTEVAKDLYSGLSVSCLCKRDFAIATYHVLRVKHGFDGRHIEKLLRCGIWEGF